MNKNTVILLSFFIFTSFLVGCGYKEAPVEANVLDINMIHSAVKENLGVDYLPDKNLSLDELADLTGIEKESIDEFVAEVSSDDFVDTFIAINAKRDTSYDAAQKLLRYKEKLEEEALNYPESIAKIKASKVERKGDTVFFIMLGKPNSMKDQESEEAIAFSEREVQRVELIINEACG